MMSTRGAMGAVARSPATRGAGPYNSRALARRRDLSKGHCANASPSPAAVTAPLTKSDLVSWVSSGCKPRSKWLIGTEHEKFGFYKSSHRRLSYETIATLLTEIMKRYEWDPITEDGKLIGLKQSGQSITLEPGGQFELSGAPLDSIHLTCAEVNSHLYQVKSIAEELDIGFLGLGFDPKWEREDIPIMPKGRYDIMRRYMPKKGNLGLDMMLRTCTIQVNLDFESEADMVEKFRVGLALQPLATALFANSPFKEGKDAEVVSLRSRVWTDTDPDRTGDLPFVFEEGFGFERYVEYVLDVPMYFLYRGGKYIDCTGQSFRTFMEGKLPMAPGELPTFDDWESHMTTVFPEVRMKRYIEMRGADGGPWNRICALPALWVGLLYDRQAQSEAVSLIADWSQSERAYLKDMAGSVGLRAPFRNGTLQDVAKEMLRIAREGLERRCKGEEKFLSSLDSIAESGDTPADMLREHVKREWDGNIDPIYEKYCY